MPPLPISAMDKAMKLLGRRAMSAKELEKKLYEAGFPAAEINETVSECRRRHYVDDAMLAADYTVFLRNRNAGSRVIRQKLVRRGLAAELPEDGSLPEEDTLSADRDAALRAMEYKLRLLTRESDPRKKREKLFRYLAGRGFAPGLIFELLSQLNEKNEADGEY